MIVLTACSSAPEFDAVEPTAGGADEWAAFGGNPIPPACTGTLGDLARVEECTCRIPRESSIVRDRSGALIEIAMGYDVVEHRAGAGALAAADREDGLGEAQVCGAEHAVVAVFRDAQPCLGRPAVGCVELAREAVSE